MRIAMIGSGYVGLVSGACFADFGHDVVCLDRDAEKIAALNQGRLPVFEPGLDRLVAENVQAGRLRFGGEMAPAVAQADIVFIAVGTPSRRGDGHADLSHVEAAAADIAGALSGFTVVATKSTVPVGTAETLERLIGRLNPHADMAVVSNPEFLREGAAIADFKHPDRIVIGCADARAEALMRALYHPLSCPLLFTSRRTAELTKYAGNAFLAMKVAFINEIADLCEKTGADVVEVARGIGCDQRIGADFLKPGPGFGGSCFPKDIKALARTAREYDAPMHLVETTIASNERRKRDLGRRVIAAMGQEPRGTTVGLLGLTFKPDTDDMREAPALSLVRALRAAGVHVQAFDPAGMAQARRLLPDIEYVADGYAAARDADCLVLMTHWAVFRALDLKRIAQIMKTPLLVDLRNFYDPAAAAAAGLAYKGIGRMAEPGEKH